MVDLNIAAIDFSLNLAVEGLLAPVFVSSQNHFNQLGQCSLGSSMWSNISEISALFGSPTEQNGAEHEDEPCNTLFRMSLRRLLVLIPSSVIENKNKFAMIVGDAEVAVGNYLGTDAKDGRSVIKKNCGSGKTWISEFLDKESTGNFYVLKSKHALLNVGCPANNMQQFNVASEFVIHASFLHVGPQYQQFVFASDNHLD